MTNPHNPANPELEQELRNILFIDPNKPRESGAIWPVYPEHFDEVWPQVQALITQREAQAYNAGIEAALGAIPTIDPNKTSEFSDGERWALNRARTAIEERRK